MRFARRLFLGSAAGIFAVAAAQAADAPAKAVDQPLWKLLGGGRDKIATYASGALRRGLKLDEAVTAAGRLREKGHRQTKMQLGLPGVTNPAREVEQAIVGQVPTAELFRDACESCRKIEAIDDVHAPAAYRQHLAAVLSRRALEKAHARLLGTDPGQARPH